MDVYDFDGTLYRGNATADFTRWCLRRYPRCNLTLPRTALAALGMKTCLIHKTQLKGALYRYLSCVPRIEEEVSLFWEHHEGHITGPCHASPGDLVISASPDFLLRSICEKHGLQLIASLVDAHTGAILSPNCSGEEKVSRFRAVYPTATISHFYSDSLQDSPLAALATKAYLVSIPRNSLIPWNVQAHH